MKKSELSKYMSKIAKLSHKKHPRPREFYVNMRSKVGKKKLSTLPVIEDVDIDLP